MDEQRILQRIHDLVEEEHELRTERASAGQDQQTRLAHLEETLDQCWDLLRRRRAARQAHGDPEAQGARPVSEVERYLQ